MTQERIFKQDSNDLLEWYQQGFYRKNGYDQTGKLCYTLEDRYRTGWWYLVDQTTETDIGEFDFPSLQAFNKAETHYLQNQ
jgi:hypothetical protein